MDRSLQVSHCQRDSFAIADALVTRGGGRRDRRPWDAEPDAAVGSVCGASSALAVVIAPAGPNAGSGFQAPKPPGASPSTDLAALDLHWRKARSSTTRHYEISFDNRFVTAMMSASVTNLRTSSQSTGTRSRFGGQCRYGIGALRMALGMLSPILTSCRRFLFSCRPAPVSEAAHSGFAF